MLFTKKNRYSKSDFFAMKNLSACLNIDGCVEERFGRCCRESGMSPGGGLWDVGEMQTFLVLPSVSIVGGWRGNSTVVKGVSVYLPLCPPRFKIMSDIPSPEHCILCHCDPAERLLLNFLNNLVSF